MTIYKSAMGHSVDFDALIAKNESIRAVGNIDVNARGDIIDKHNQVVKSVNERVAESSQDHQTKPLSSELSASELELEEDNEVIKK